MRGSMFISKFMMVIVPVLVAAGFIFTFAMIFSPKLRGKMMARQFKAMKHMVDYSANDIADMAKTAGDLSVGVKKRFQDEHHDDLMDMAEFDGELTAKKIKATAEVVKDVLGSTGSNKPQIYCKHCGASIDADSRFCKSCGQEQ